MSVYTQPIIIEGTEEGAFAHISSITQLDLVTFRNSPDYFELNIEDKLTISIEKVRELINWTSFRPFQSEFKIAVILKSDKLTPEAQNSLLKLLEEPPSRTHIYLICTNAKILLPTIRSRAILERIGGAVESNQVEDSSDILSASISDKFKWIDEVTRIKIPSEKREKVNNFFHDAYKLVSSSNLDSTTKSHNLQLIEKSLVAVKRNVNTKLVLENFFINLR